MKKQTFQTVIIDDEADARGVLREMINRFCPQLNICGEAGSVAEGFETIQHKMPDIVFLDVDLHDGSGFDILDAFSPSDFKVVFVTAHEDFALKAFQYRAHHYLLKPIDPQDIILVVNEIEKAALPLQNELSQLNKHNRLLLPTIQGIAVVDAAQIQHIKSDDKHATLVLSTNEKIFISQTLKELEAILPAGDFIRVHQSWIVRIDAIRKVQKMPGSLALLLKDKTVIQVSRRHRDEVLRALGAI